MVSIPSEAAHVATMPLLFHNEQAQVDRDPEVLASRLAQHYSLLDFGPRPGYEHSFLHRSSTAAAGELLLSCGYTSPIQGAVGERDGVGSINLCCSGAATYQLAGQELRINPQRPLFFSPGLEYRYSVEHFNGLAFDFNLTRLRETAAAIAGLGASPRRFAGLFEAPRLIGLEEGRCQRLLRLLRRELALLDDPLLQEGPELSHLAIDDLIYRTLALLFCPELAVASEDQVHGRVPRSAQRERHFEELLEWIRAHLSESIRLTALEQRSGYSRRSLQLAFQQRFGCGPMQWVRRQRLEQVRQALLQPSASDNVSEIASRHGFRNLSMFSRDFSAHFGLRPSELLRDARRQHD
ncbi:MAG: helix-turn-helix domain-containing protein [Synechococcaceae cyanobacterium]|jgi:AraC-like DNA-binding protein